MGTSNDIFIDRECNEENNLIVFNCMAVVNIIDLKSEKWKFAKNSLVHSPVLLENNNMNLWKPE